MNYEISLRKKLKKKKKEKDRLYLVAMFFFALVDVSRLVG
jgi:hypothetical protein